mmetsp:Transcript_134335/g.245106  ORF Transcript_134335/g.245106 Transcript_134335/m.245106 type:complete len:204 (-) Transcript_134335:1420-2031(-)
MTTCSYIKTKSIPLAGLFKRWQPYTKSWMAMTPVSSTSIRRKSSWASMESRPCDCKNISTSSHCTLSKTSILIVSSSTMPWSPRRYFSSWQKASAAAISLCTARSRSLSWSSFVSPTNTPVRTFRTPKRIKMRYPQKTGMKTHEMRAIGSMNSTQGRPCVRLWKRVYMALSTPPYMSPKSLIKTSSSFGANVMMPCMKMMAKR